MKCIKQLWLLALLMLTLQGCVFVAGAAAGAAAIAVVYDHRTISKTISDTRIANTIYDKMRLEPGLKNDSHVEVTVFNGVVLLTGETPTQTLCDEAYDLARTTQHVRKVYNQIRIEGPSSTLTRTSDAWITAKIKGQMLAAHNLKSGSIKVLTENGTVYLMGIVSKQQAALAVNIARQVTGVQRVVKIFQYTH